MGHVMVLMVPLENWAQEYLSEYPGFRVNCNGTIVEFGSIVSNWYIYCGFRLMSLMVP
jgi:hypothetical protein